MGRANPPRARPRLWPAPLPPCPAVSRILRYIPWIATAILGAGALATIALGNGEKVSAAWLLTAAIWGGSYSMVKSALAFYPVAGVIALRFLLSALFLLPYWLRLPRAQQRATLQAALP